MTIDAVIFDWGGTLTPWHPVDLAEQWRCYAQAYAAAAAGVAGAAGRTEATALASQLAELEAAAWVACRDAHTSARIDEIIASAGVDVGSAGHAAGTEAYFGFWTPHSYTDPDAEPLFDHLHERGIKVGVLSNTIWPRRFHEDVFRRDGVLDRIDGAVYTSEVPWTKPHPEAFRAAMQAVGVDDPAHAVFVGDRLFDDVYGAGQAGMRTVFVPHTTVPPGQAGPTEGVPDATVERLADVAEVVDRWSRESG